MQCRDPTVFGDRGVGEVQRSTSISNSSGSLVDDGGAGSDR